MRMGDGSEITGDRDGDTRSVTIIMEEALDNSNFEANSLRSWPRKKCRCPEVESFYIIKSICLKIFCF
jgi:hypothetical protein